MHNFLDVFRFWPDRTRLFGYMPLNTKNTSLCYNREIVSTDCFGCLYFYEKYSEYFDDLLTLRRGIVVLWATCL